MKHRFRTSAIAIVLTLVAGGQCFAQITWQVNNTTNIGGHPVTARGNPQVVHTPVGDVVRFNGINDGLIVSNNPLAGMSNLTVELIFKPDPLTVPTAGAPRIVHIQTPGDSASEHRFTMEEQID